MGFSGEIHLKKGLKYDNTHGKLIFKEREENNDDEYDDQSDIGSV